jgi:hypothetical protein
VQVSDERDIWLTSKSYVEIDIEAGRIRRRVNALHSETEILGYTGCIKLLVANKMRIIIIGR